MFPGYKTLKDLLTESGLEKEGLITDIIDTEQKMRQIDIGKKKIHSLLSHLFINVFLTQLYYQ